MKNGHLKKISRISLCRVALRIEQYAQEIVICKFNSLICTSPQLHIRHSNLVRRVVIDIDIDLANLVCHNLYRGNMVITVKIIRIEQSILFSKKRVFSWRKGRVKITTVVRSYGLNKPGVNSSVKSRPTPGGLPDLNQ